MTTIINEDLAKKAQDLQNHFLDNSHKIIMCILNQESKEINKIVYTEMCQWTGSITSQQRKANLPNIAKNMNGSPFSQLTYIKKLFTDFLLYNDEFNKFYKINYNTPIINMLLQKKLINYEFANSDFNLIDILIDVYCKLNLKIDAIFYYRLSAVSIKNYLLMHKLGHDKNKSLLILNPSKIANYKSKIIDQASTTEKENYQRFFTKEPITTNSILFTDNANGELSEIWLPR